jgi:hypothetical protein
MPQDDKHYRDAVLRLSELAGDRALLDGFTFENCYLKGPAILLPKNNSMFFGNQFDAPADSVLWEIDPSREAVTGAIEATRCTFEGCHFTRVGLAGLPDTVHALRQSMGA